MIGSGCRGSHCCTVCRSEDRRAARRERNESRREALDLSNTSSSRSGIFFAVSAKSRSSRHVSSESISSLVFVPCFSEELLGEPRRDVLVPVGAAEVKVVCVDGDHMLPASTSMTVTSNVPPPRSYTSTFWFRDVSSVMPYIRHRRGNHVLLHRLRQRRRQDRSRSQHRRRPHHALGRLLRGLSELVPPECSGTPAGRSPTARREPDVAAVHQSAYERHCLAGGGSAGSASPWNGAIPRCRTWALARVPPRLPWQDQPAPRIPERALLPAPTAGNRVVHPKLCLTPRT